MPGPLPSGVAVVSDLAADIAVAAQLLDGVVHRTPLAGCHQLSDLVGGPVRLKCENLQRAGSFKIRGAYVRISRLSPAERAAGVVAASAGNHAQGVALAGRLLGAPVTVVMPHGAPLPKVEATRGYGAQVRFAGASVDEALVVATAHAVETGAVLIHPFDHHDIVAGQGTVGREILEQCPDVATVVVGSGGGGLLAGVATAVKAVRPDVRVVGVQAERAAALPGSLAAGRPTALAEMATMADGIAIGRPGAVPFAVIQELVDDVVTVSEDAMARALLLCLERTKMLVEPAGVASVAALLEHPGAFAPPVVAILSGGNVDPLLLLGIVRHGLAAAGRFLSLTVQVPDRPGALVGVLAAVASTDASVVSVEHSRTDPRLSIGEVSIALELETRGADHRAEVVAGLRATGHPLVVAP